MSSELAAGEALRFDDVWKRYRLGTGGAWAGDLRDEAGHLLRRLLGRAAAAPTVDALAGVSFSVQRGENVALVGANAAGKTTALKLIARITVPTRGLVQVRGRVASLIQIGAGFHRELTGRENVYLYGAILGLTRREIRARYGEIVEFAGLDRFMDTPVKRYSHGMYVRLGFSVAVHVDADVLLVDEVLAVGDREFRERCLDRMRSFVESDTTLLFVSHQRELVEAACERGLLLEEGRLAADGPAGEIWRAYEERGGAGSLARPADGAERPPVAIQSLELRDGAGRATVRGREGEPLTVRVAFAVHEDVEGAAFRLTLFSGTTQVFSTSSADEAALEPFRAGARGTAELALDRLALLPGEYHVEAEVRAALAGRTVRCDALDVPLLVEGRGLGHGFASLGPRWRVASDAPAKSPP